MDHTIKTLEPFQLLEPQECRHIIGLAGDQGLAQGTMAMGQDHTIRSSSVAWLDLEPEPYYDIFKTVEGYTIDWIYTPLQISRYQEDQFYDWHVDTLSSRRSSQRCLTLTCCLQPAADAVLRVGNRVFDLALGEAVIFPSDTLHRADAPSQGERWALTIWGMKHNKREAPAPEKPLAVNAEKGTASACGSTN